MQPQYPLIYFDELFFVSMGIVASPKKKLFNKNSIEKKNIANTENFT